MTTTDELADALAESACVLADSGSWSATALDDALTATETLLEALAERLDPAAAHHLSAVRPALARLREHLGEAPEPPAGRSEPARSRRRRIGLGPGAGQVLARAPKA
ncbi:hypothetical protein [Streptomyces sp. SP18BB07]|uniref:hypothetical protein n=1 Tax=Streptomyces sp. SP18BB07 TaxID=3002522 RepID=UPI002E788E83|nr:hypothetical protein [Streptomyces sp. SP18BB07]MEE1764346.1 hypothetical protein [Streptomyces sp. SP18BB07]